MAHTRNVIRLLASAVGLVLICRISAVALHNRTPSAMCNAATDCSYHGDCSFQIPGAAVNSCLARNCTADCSSTLYHATHPSKLMLFESEAGFSVGLQPYIYISKDLETKPFSSLNITLKTKHLGVTGFVLMLQRNLDSYNSCRIFDFSAARNANKNINVSLFYDCYINLEQQGTSPYDLIVRSLPANEELHYSILVQGTQNIVREWEKCQNFDIHVMMLNVGNLQKNLVEVKYASGMPSINITGLRIVLTSATGYQKTADLMSSIGDEMLVARFESVPEGRYNVVFVDNSPVNTCNSWRPLEFILVKTLGEDDKPQWVFIVIVCGVAAGVILIIALLGSLCIHLNKTSPLLDELLEPVTAPIVYSYDCEKHFEVIQKFAPFLEARCKLHIVLDEKDRDPKKDPITWISTEIEKSETIILVISKGVDHKIERDNVPVMEEGQPMVDLLTTAVKQIEIKFGKQSLRLAMVVFDDYTDSNRVPKCLTNCGRTFCLPGQMRQFLCYLHRRSPVCFPIKFYPKMPGEDLEDSTEGKALVAAIKDMQTYQKQNPGWFRAKTSRGDGAPCPSTDASRQPLLHCPNAVEIES